MGKENNYLNFQVPSLSSESPGRNLERLSFKPLKNLKDKRQKENTPPKNSTVLTFFKSVRILYLAAL